ncbi:MAG: ACT domain-containing protein [Coriobacteriales bacterium]|jgi:ACT domain-containing protein
MKTSAVVSVLGKDRTGIVATVSSTLYECGANIDDIRQTILNDMFSMTMLVTLDEDKCPFEQVQDKLEKDGEDLGLQIRLQRKDVFDFMYKI